MKNKIIAHLSIIMILVGVFCNVCTTYNRISFYDYSIYAEADNWSSCDSSDLVTAFRYYCKSRNLAIEGSIADSLTTFTTTTFNNICSTLGIDPTSLQAELKKTTEGNLGLRFLFSNTGITAYNRIFAEFLQNNNLAVGDEVDNKVVLSQNIFVDDDGNKCVPYVVNMSGNGSNSEAPNSAFVSAGTYYKYSHSDIYSGLNCIFNINNRTYTKTVVSGVGSGTYWSPLGEFFSLQGGGDYAFIGAGISVGDICIIFNQNTNHYLLGSIGIRGNFPTNNYYYNNFGLYVLADITGTLTDDNIQHADVYITTNNNTINNNTYNNNYTIIYNDGNTYITDDDEEPLPTTPPDGGGGGGGDNPDNPDIPPVDPTPTPDPTIPDWDIELPEMPTGNDWLLYGLEKKFPWDIPYNLMYMLSLFAADPETPHFEGTLDFKIVQWDYDIDLAPFDDIAGYVRDMEFIGFLLGLMLLTRKLIWG